MIVKTMLSKLDFLLNTAILAGEAILDVYDGEFDVEFKTDESPLTEADKRSHEIIKRRLEEMTPSLPILSEEGAVIPYSVRSRWPAFWLVDPLDGTKEFVNRNGEFTVNIALIENKTPVVGVVYVPVKKNCYFAVHGSGAFRRDGGEIIEMVSDEILASSKRLPLSRAGTGEDDSITVVASRSHATGEANDFADRLKKIYREVVFTPAGSAMKLCLVAEGSADLYPRHGPTMEWDIGAGQCVVEQSGGKVISLETENPLIYNKECLKNSFFICSRKGFFLKHVS
ncbi:MAG: 3'(2'),5'-bisphosphate nucleotidase CysQ [bacterium]|nr:3'(2'),5'-bisphosphate nucleotidase CysQ [bacterium]